VSRALALTLLGLLLGCGAPVEADDADSVEPPLHPLQLQELELDGDWSLVTGFAFVPESPGELLLWSKEGRVGHLQLLDDNSSLLLGEFQLQGVHPEGDCGLISMVFDPFFEDNGLLWAALCTSQQASAIHRLRWDGEELDAVPGSAVEVMAAGDPAAEWPRHNIGAIGFEPDEAGTMWALFGDKFRRSNAQAPWNNLGAMVRIVPDRDESGSGYSPAPDNPWPNRPGYSPDIFAWGLRSPWTGLLDRHGRWWIGDVGANEAEEIDLVTEPGANLGWSHCEGPCAEPGGKNLEPTLWWDRGPHDYVLDDAEARPTSSRTAWVGCEYLPEAGLDRYGGLLTNRVLFGDYVVGFVRAAEVDPDGVVLFDQHVAPITAPVAWRQGPAGFVYAATLGDGQEGYPDPESATVSRLWRVLLAE